MLRVLLFTVVATISAGAAPPAGDAPASRTLTGWFSDKNCARVTPGEAPRPNGTACVTKCLHKGVPAVFVSEDPVLILHVGQASMATDHVGYRVEVTGVLNAEGDGISIDSVRRLSTLTSICALPPRKGSDR
jgi:hypothetical protein